MNSNVRSVDSLNPDCVIRKLGPTEQIFLGVLVADHSITSKNRFIFALIRGGKFFQSQEVTYPNPAVHKNDKRDHGRRAEIKESFDDTWLAEKMSEAYARELRYVYFLPMRKISFATYIRVCKFPSLTIGSDILRYLID
jgi:hypothetical protein